MGKKVFGAGGHSIIKIRYQRITGLYSLKMQEWSKELKSNSYYLLPRPQLLFNPRMVITKQLKISLWATHCLKCFELLLTSPYSQPHEADLRTLNNEKSQSEVQIFAKVAQQEVPKHFKSGSVCKQPRLMHYSTLPSKDTKYWQIQIDSLIHLSHLLSTQRL